MSYLKQIRADIGMLFDSAYKSLTEIDTLIWKCVRVK